ncbi:hypothetical protein Ccrd_002153, partial [Cynara cardunculus var. scolymus]
MTSATDDCFRIWKVLAMDAATSHCTNNILDQRDRRLLLGFCLKINTLESGKIYSKPMLWIGIYIAVATLLCMFLMLADLFHGFRNRKLWFPSKYFTLNTTTIILITIAMKLPVDLSGQMPGAMDQLAKTGSMTFMCTMMSNLMPSLASMDNRELLANVTGTVIIGVFCVNCCKSLKANFFLTRIASNCDTSRDDGYYVLQLQDKMELGRRTLKSFSNSANRSIQKGEKQLPTNLLKLIEQCRRFEGVVKFDSGNIQRLNLVTFPNSWSLPIVTLTCIAITLPNISQESVDNLFR